MSWGAFVIGRSEEAPEGAGFEEVEARNVLFRKICASSEAMREAMVDSASDFTRPKQWEKIRGWNIAGLKSDELFTQC